MLHVQEGYLLSAGETSIPYVPYFALSCQVLAEGGIAKSAALGLRST